jgi:hypothetical protein
MDLKTFISETLKEIIQGVEEAQIKSTNSVINPHVEYRAETHNRVQSVEFDIAVTAEKGTETKGGIVVFGGAFSLGSQGTSKASDTIVNRIKFSIPIAFQSSAREPNYIPNQNQQQI